MSKILLIDGLNFIWKSDIKFSSTKGTKYSYTTIYNFFRGLRSLIEEFSPEKVFFALESKSNFRYSLFPDYKQNRKNIIKTSNIQNTKYEEFSSQRDTIIELLEYLPITKIYADGYEADDVISFLSHNLQDEEIIIISNDTDYIQLLQKKYGNIKIFNPIKKEFVVAPEYYYLVYKVLAGDKSDNIPGLVSANEAEKLTRDPKLLAEFLDNKENKSNFNLNKELIEFAVIPEDKLVLIDGQLNLDKLQNEFKIMEFNSILKEPYWERFRKTFTSLV